MLESLSEVYLAVGGEGSGWREKGFKRAAAVLRGLGTEISDVQQLRVRREVCVPAFVGALYKYHRYPWGCCRPASSCLSRQPCVKRGAVRT